MSVPELLLSNQLCFRVYRLEREMLAAYRPLLEALGLTYPQYLVMLVLWEKKSASVGALCADLGLDTGTLSPLLKRLEAAGLVERRRSAEDERTVLVSLSPKGKSLEAEARPIPGALASCLFEGTGEEAKAEYLELRGALDKALERLRRRSS